MLEKMLEKMWRHISIFKFVEPSRSTVDLW
jgi:hypothetical protein